MTQQQIHTLQPLIRQALTDKQNLETASKEMAGYVNQGKQAPQDLLIRMGTCAVAYQQSLEKLQKKARQFHLPDGLSPEEIQQQMMQSDAPDDRTVLLAFFCLISSDPSVEAALDQTRKNVVSHIQRASRPQQNETILAACRAIMEAVRNHAESLTEEQYDLVERNFGRSIARAVDRQLLAFAPKPVSAVRFHAGKKLLAPPTASELDALQKLLKPARPAGTEMQKTGKTTERTVKAGTAPAAQTSRSPVPRTVPADKSTEKKSGAKHHALLSLFAQQKILAASAVDAFRLHVPGLTSELQNAIAEGLVCTHPVSLDKRTETIYGLTQKGWARVQLSTKPLDSLSGPWAQMIQEPVLLQDLSDTTLQQMLMLHLDSLSDAGKDHRLFMAVPEHFPFAVAMRITDSQAFCRIMVLPDTMQNLGSRFRRFQQVYHPEHTELIAQQDAELSLIRQQLTRSHGSRKGIELRIVRMPAVSSEPTVQMRTERPTPRKSAAPATPVLRLHSAQGNPVADWQYAFHQQSVAEEELKQELLADPDKVFALATCQAAHFLPVEHTTSRNGLSAMPLNATGKRALSEPLIRELFQKRLLVRLSVHRNGKKYDAYVLSDTGIAMLKSLKPQVTFCRQKLIEYPSISPDSVSASQAMQVQRIQECVLSRKRPCLAMISSISQDDTFVIGTLPAQASESPRVILAAIAPRGKETVLPRTIEDFLHKHTQDALLVLCEYPSDMQAIRSVLRLNDADASRLYFCVRGTPDKLFPAAEGEPRTLTASGPATLDCSIRLRAVSPKADTLKAATGKTQEPRPVQAEKPADIPVSETRQPVLCPELPVLPWNEFSSPLSRTVVRLTGGSGVSRMTAEQYAEDQLAARHLTLLLSFLHRRLLILPEELQDNNAGITENDLRTARKLGYLSDLTIRESDRASLFLTLSEKAWSVLNAPFFQSQLTSAGLKPSQLQHPWWNAAFALQVMRIRGHMQRLNQDYQLLNPLSSGLVPARDAGGRWVFSLIPSALKTQQQLRDFCTILLTEKDCAATLLAETESDAALVCRLFQAVQFSGVVLDIRLASDSSLLATLPSRRDPSAASESKAPAAGAEAMRSVLREQTAVAECIRDLFTYQVLTETSLQDRYQELEATHWIESLQFEGDSNRYLVLSDVAREMYADIMSTVDTHRPSCWFLLKQAHTWSSDFVYRCLALQGEVRHLGDAAPASQILSVDSTPVLVWSEDGHTQAMVAITLSDLKNLNAFCRSLTDTLTGITWLFLLPDSRETMHAIPDLKPLDTDGLCVSVWNGELPQTKEAASAFRISGLRSAPDAFQFAPGLAQVRGKHGLKEVLALLRRIHVLNLSVPLPYGLTSGQIAYAQEFGYLDTFCMEELLGRQDFAILSGKGMAAVQHPRIQPLLEAEPLLSCPRESLFLPDTLIPLVRLQKYLQLHDCLPDGIGMPETITDLVLAVDVHRQILWFTPCLHVRTLSELLPSLQALSASYPGWHLVCIAEPGSGRIPVIPDSAYASIQIHSVLLSRSSILVPDAPPAPVWTESETLLSMPPREFCSQLENEALTAIASGREAIGLSMLDYLKESPWCSSIATAFHQALHAPEASSGLTGTAGIYLNLTRLLREPDWARTVPQYLRETSIPSDFSSIPEPSDVSGDLSAFCRRILQNGCLLHEIHSLSDLAAARILYQTLLESAKWPDMPQDPLLDFASQSLIPLKPDGVPLLPDIKLLPFPAACLMLLRDYLTSPARDAADLIKDFQARPDTFCLEIGTVEAVLQACHLSDSAHSQLTGALRERLKEQAACMDPVRKQNQLLSLALADGRLSGEACTLWKEQLARLHSVCESALAFGFENRLLDLGLAHPSLIGNMPDAPYPDDEAARQLFREGHAAACIRYAACADALKDLDACSVRAQSVFAGFLSRYDDNYRACSSSGGQSMGDIFRRRHFERTDLTRSGEAFLRSVPRPLFSAEQVRLFLESFRLRVRQITQTAPQIWDVTFHTGPLEDVPLKTFGTGLTQTGLRVMLAHDETLNTAEALASQLHQTDNENGQRPLLLILNSAIPLTERRRFGMHSAHVSDIPPYLILDKVTTLYLSEFSEHDRWNALLHCSLPFGGMPFRACDALVSDRLYGREDVLEKLLKAQGPVMLSGEEGTGKTTVLQALAKRFHRPSEQSYAMMIDAERVPSVPEAILKTMTEYGLLPPRTALPKTRWASKLTTAAVGKVHLLVIILHADGLTASAEGLRALNELAKAESEQVHCLISLKSACTALTAYHSLPLTGLSIESAEQWIIETLSVFGRFLPQYVQTVLLPLVTFVGTSPAGILRLIRLILCHTPASLLTPPYALNQESVTRIMTDSDGMHSNGCPQNS